jgi:mono/diheme cytochrome c family protein
VKFVLILLAAAAMSPVQRAPERSRALVNPLEGREDAVRAGEKLYRRECASCHGAGRQGKGRAPSLRQDEVVESEPGALYWVLTNGSLGTGMPSFAHLPPAERWQIVSWLRRH